MSATAVTGGALGQRWTLRFAHYSAEQLFALVSDIESYPQFVPGCVATRILERRPDGTWLVDNVFGAGPLRQRFMSRARPEAPHRLEVVSQDGPWRRFAMLWTFRPEGDGCSVDVELELSLRSPLLSSLAGAGLSQIEPRIVRAFEERAERLYGRPGSRPGIQDPEEIA